MMNQDAGAQMMNTNDYRNAITTSYDATRLDAFVASLKASTRSITAEVNVLGALFYARIRVRFPTLPLPSKEFDGESGGVFSIGGAYAIGELYTSDAAALFANTSGFSFAFVGPLFQIWFWDGGGGMLGYYEGAGGGTFNGFGGGGGSWR